MYNSHLYPHKSRHPLCQSLRSCKDSSRDIARKLYVKPGQIQPGSPRSYVCYRGPRVGMVLKPSVKGVCLPIVRMCALMGAQLRRCQRVLRQP